MIFDKSKGLTLLEILTSILILVVIVSSVALSIPTNVGMTRKSDDKETATLLAQKYIENVKKSFDETPTNFESLTSGTTPPITISSEHTNYGKFSITTSTTIDNTTVFYSGQPNQVTAPCLVTLQVTVTPANANTVTGSTTSSQAVTLTTMLRRDRL